MLIWRHIQFRFRLICMAAMIESFAMITILFCWFAKMNGVYVRWQLMWHVQWNGKFLDQPGSAFQINRIQNNNRQCIEKKETLIVISFNNNTTNNSHIIWIIYSWAANGDLVHCMHFQEISTWLQNHKYPQILNAVTQLREKKNIEMQLTLILLFIQWMHY